MKTEGTELNFRRNLVIAIGTGAVASPFCSFAQQKDKVWRVGLLMPQRRPASIETHYYGAFLQGMRELAYVEGTNLKAEWRFADGDTARLPSLAAELVQSKADAIVASGLYSMDAARDATSMIPIVMVGTGDPVSGGWIKSLSRPGGNITGATTYSEETIVKQLQMLLEFAPNLTRVAVLLARGNRQHGPYLARIRAAAAKVRVNIFPVEAQNAQEIETAFTNMKKAGAGAVIVLTDGIFNPQARLFAELALKHRMAATSAVRHYADAGCLMSYGASLHDSFRRGAYYVDRIFKGAKPADLPVEQPTKFELFINGKTAKALGLTIPQSLLISADKVIE
jgi:putative tryptophan/tyrosine transport system substrate-binding protein